MESRKKHELRYTRNSCHEYMRHYKIYCVWRLYKTRNNNNNYGLHTKSHQITIATDFNLHYFQLAE